MTLIPITERTQYCFVDCGKEICQCKPSKKIQMNKELTAMQMLIEAMQKDYDSIDDTANFALHTKKSEIGIRIRQAKYLLQKEQEQIEMAFGDGVSEGESRERMEEIYLSIGDYYQYKYGGEDVDR